MLGKSCVKHDIITIEECCKSVGIMEFSLHIKTAVCVELLT